MPKHFESILKQDPDHLTALNAKAAMLMKLGKSGEAKECYKKLDAMAPFNLERIQKMGEMYLQTSDPINAKSKFKELIDLCPEEPDLKFEKIAAFFRAGFKEAGVEFATETSTPAEVVRYYNNRGVVLIQSGKIEEALLEYRRALVLFPKHSQNYKIIFNMALAHLRMRPPQPQKATKCLEETLKRKPTYDKALTLLGKLKNNTQVGELTEENLDDKSL